MSTLRWATTFIISALSFQVLANPLAEANAPSVQTHRMDISDTEFCRKARFDRDNTVQKEPDLIRGTEPIHTDDQAMCFSPDENLFFSANREAQKILGPHALWYVKISAEFRVRVQEACKIMGFENDEVSRAFDHCVESRFEELMGPYEVRYRREAGSYITKRRQVAESLVVRCDVALSVKRSRLPRDIRFPTAYYDPNLSSVPKWLLEEKIDDIDWLKRMSKLKVNDIMHDILGNDCPGNMVYWVTYSGPN